MLNNQAAAAPAAQHTGLKNVRILATSALLAAISVVLARLIIPMPNETTRFSLEAVPIFIAGMLFGPIPGALVGFVADFVGCLFSGYGYNPMFCIPPILYGLSAGLFRPMLVKKVKTCYTAYNRNMGGKHDDVHKTLYVAAWHDLACGR